MRKVARSALVPYTAEQMYALVEEVDAYPDFLPWCTGVIVHSRNAEEIDATLELERGSIRKSFRTRNSLQPGKAMKLELIGGPFKHLEGFWLFEQLGTDGSKVSLDLEFEFESRVTDAVFGSFFESTCNSLVNSFTDRARKVYG
ncbi:MAG TPA: type II toxin-antitoxin system RatA family toxin [Woeseiaceae bacterium]|nr:type II toxin-antitoxin system RatA family toxin [Woeseiaceae bacterium]